MEIRPCPFCGSEKTEIITMGMSGEMFVSCGECFTYGPVAQKEDEAIRKWNQRTIKP